LLRSHTHTHTHTHARARTHTHTCARAHTHAHSHTRTPTHTRTHTHTRSHTRTHTRSHTHTHTHTHTHERAWLAHTDEIRANPAFCNVLVKLAEQHCGDAVTLDLSSNGIKSLGPIRRLGAALKAVERLSLANNELKSISELGHFKEMERVHCLVLQGNAALERREKEPVTYEKTVRKHFPQLCEIDGHPLSSAMPLPVLGGFVPGGGVGDAVAAFLSKFFACVDEPGRPELLLAYSPVSVMTLTLNLSGGVAYPMCYKAVNRNLRNHKLLKKGADGGAMADKVHVGPEIAGMYQSLPMTTHHADTMLVDVWMVTDDLLGVTVTGTFAEFKQDGGAAAAAARLNTIDRPFRRCFLLCPTVPGTEAAAHGWPATVANEHLHVGSLANAPVRPVASAAPPQDIGAIDAAAAAAAASAAGAPGVVDRDALVMQFMHATGMNTGFALECLDGNGWNPDAALADFQHLQASGALPPEAFALDASALAAAAAAIHL
jgi:nuclear RNA export factor